uniref:Small ribosomal subunit protein uS8c n=1 Tax=Lepocinclis steinii TaxID=459226 RepID=A0A3G3LLN3_9EUGL|nr:ribosomal protein S8 [Lepocinclis steinii]AYQ93617.1 ribosomal protein S8 [Lepocinclis steinii]
MGSNDLISDMLTRIRNANLVGLEKVLVPYTNVNFDIIKILKDEGFIDSFDRVKEEKPNSSKLDFISINLKFKKGLKQKPYISFMKRVSKPGLRVYVNSHNIPKVWGGIGIAVLSTSNGLMTNKLAKLKGLGGEVLFYIW